MLAITISILYLATAIVSTATGNPKGKVEIPIHYSYGGYPRIQTNISWGTPAQKPIPVIFDTGSIAFWTYGPNATINDGSQYLGLPGPCNKKVKQFFDWPKSSTHTAVKTLKSPLGYSYGGNGKLVEAPQEINDTISFHSTDVSPIEHVQVALSNYTIVRQLDKGCKIDVNSFDQSILGVGPFGIGRSSPSSTGPSFRQNLRDQGKLSSKIMSLWMKKAPDQTKGIYHGTALFGEPLPKTAYTGRLVSIKQIVPTESYVGYYAALPSLTLSGGKVTVSDSSVKNCLLDSGTGQDQLPFSIADVSKYSKVVQYTSKDGYLLTAWNGTCASIPAKSTFDFSFPGAIQGQSVAIKLPIRSYARGIADNLPNIPETVCPLSLELDNSGGCVFGAPFFTAAALQFDDDRKTISLAQGGIA